MRKPITKVVRRAKMPTRFSTLGQSVHGWKLGSPLAQGVQAQQQSRFKWSAFVPSRRIGSSDSLYCRLLRWDAIVWLDPAGYEVARSVKPGDWPEKPALFQFELLVAVSVVIGEPYLPHR